MPRCPYRHTGAGARADEGITVRGASADSHTLALDIRLCNGGVVLVDRIAQITARTLALAGAASPQWAREPAQVIAATIPGGQHCAVEG